MHAYLFLFYATTVNIPMGLHTTKLSTWGFRIYDASDEYFLISFYNAMLKQKSKYAKK
jgi:hypothetical protein